MSDILRAHIRKRWAAGDSIGNVRVSVRSLFGETLPTETIRRLFVEFDHQERNAA